MSVKKLSVKKIKAVKGGTEVKCTYSNFGGSNTGKQICQ
jgi:hypothetical protein